jgi:hypothetical protein
MSFQTQVNRYPAPAVAGNFASANPRASVLAEEGALVAGVGGVDVGKFAWNNNGVVQGYGTAPNAPDGFVGRAMQALIKTYLDEEGVNIPQGFPVTLFNEGDFWAINDGLAVTTIGEAIYAQYSDGKVIPGAAVPTGSSVTGSLGSTNTGAIGATFTASAGSPTTKLVVTAVTGFISAGDTVSGTGIVPGTTIVSQDAGGTPNGAGTYNLSQANTCSSATVTCFGKVLKTTVCTGFVSIGDSVSGGAGFPAVATIATQVSGTPNGIGVYTLSAPATAYVASATGVTTFGNVIDVTVIGSGTLLVGYPISGGTIPANASIASQVSGTAGGIGIYTLNAPGLSYGASTTLTGVAGVLTAWKAKSVANPGELVKISTWG